MLHRETVMENRETKCHGNIIDKVLENSMKGNIRNIYLSVNDFVALFMGLLPILQ